LDARDPAANPTVLRGHEAQVGAVKISPDNRWIITGSYDNTARLWDLGARNPAANSVLMSGHTNSVSVVAFSPHNRWVVTGSGDSTARVWLLKVNDLIELAHDAVRRNFSRDEWKLDFSGEKYRKTFPDLPGPD
jgi:WD40 repeat protein